MSFKEILTFKENLDRSRPWGGSYISQLKEIPQASDEKIGESWEISVNPSSPGVIDSGNHSGKALQDVITQFPNDILGQRVRAKYGNEFPLLLKILDANDHLSVQVHPSTEYGKEHHGDKYGKEEAWYVLPDSEGGVIYLGLTDQHDLKEFEEVVRSGQDFELDEYMNRIEVQPGECYFLRTGTLHALGKGTKVIEIQRDSDRTYRAYDYNRLGNDGKPRELHLDHAFKVIDAEKRGQACIDHIKTSPQEINANDFLHLPKDAEHFQLRSLKLAKGQKLNIQTQDSFHTVTAMSEMALNAEDQSINLQKGFSGLVPASLSEYEIEAKSDGFAIVCFIPN